MNKLRWYVIWNKQIKGYAVMQGEFMDSWYDHKFEAVNRCEQLNGLD